MIRIRKACIACGVCVDICPVTALRLTKTGVIVDKNVCLDCGICYKKCPFGAIKLPGADNKALIRDIRFQVTRGCNFNCPWCFSDAKRRLDDELSLAEAIRMARQLIACGLKTMTLTGGEPLLRKDFCVKLLRYLHKHKIYTKLFTNGALLNEAVIGEISGIVNEVQISNYSSSFWPKLRSLFAQLKKNKIRAVMRITLTAKNYKRIKAMVKFAEDNKVDALRVRPFITKGRGQRHRHSLISEKISQGIGYLVSIRRDRGYPIQLLTPSFPFIYDEYINPGAFSGYGFRGYTLCKCIEDMGAILPEGSVRACGYFPQDIGNIRKQDFRKIWSRKNGIKNGLIVDRLDKECMECPYVAICGGGCRANAYINAGGLTKPDPLCPRIRRIKKAFNFSFIER